MNKNLFWALIFICSVVKAEGVFDGIWETENLGYLSVHEKEGDLIIIRLSDGWVAYSGKTSGNTARVETIIGETKTVLNVIALSENTFSATQESCIPLTGSCLLPDGFSFQGNKIW